MYPQDKAGYRPLSARETGKLAEIIVSDPNYRDALNAPYTESVTPEEYDTLRGHQNTADTVLAASVQEAGIGAPTEVQKWHAGREAVIALLSHKALGSFEDYFLGEESISPIPETEQDVLPKGDIVIAGTNNRIVRFGASIADPLEFIDTSLGIIDRQRMLGRDKIGPENYATALKLFSDKYSSIERDVNEADSDAEALTLPDLAEVKLVVSETLRGFVNVSQRDAPNYLEMTNIYASIRSLPKGVIQPEFTHDILMHTAINLDQFGKRASRVVLEGIAKMDTSDFPLETSGIVNMLMNQSGDFQNTRELRTNLRAIDTLKKNPQTDAAIRLFLEKTEGFDEPLDVEGIDEVMDRLSRIIATGTEDQTISIQAKEFAKKCMNRASGLARYSLASGNLTQAQTEQLRDTYFRIKANFLVM